MAAAAGMFIIKLAAWAATEDEGALSLSFTCDAVPVIFDLNILS